MSESYDVAIIGAGPGGYVAGIRAGQLGLSPIVIDKSPDLGGVCLNWGCIPTKALIKNAEVVEAVVRHGADFGIEFEKVTADWGKAVARSQRVRRRMNKGIAGLFKKYGVAHLQGEARFTDAHRLEVSTADGGQEIEAAHVVIATGSHS
ncbi:MAG: FAD-dependent oxidoreductase, partial [Anaerolineae bacterium]